MKELDISIAKSINSVEDDPPAAKLLTILLVAALATLLFMNRHTFDTDLPSYGQGVLFWAGLLFGLSFFPVVVEDFLLTFDLPVLLAICILFPPELAAAVCFVASCDARELRRGVTLSRAIFNRAQIAVGVFAAGSVFHAVASDVRPWYRAGLGTVLALAAEYLVNVLLVGLHVALRRRIRLRAAIAKLHVGNWWQFLGTYLTYGFLALVLASLFLHVGPWSVVAFVAPILVARQTLLRAQELQRLADRLRERERLLESMFNRLVDERRDERLRIAAELHDESLQELTRLWLGSQTLMRLQPVGPELVSELRNLSEGAEQCMDSIRDVIGELRTSVLGRGGLVPSLEGMVRELRSRWKKAISMELPAQGDVAGVDHAIQVLAYQVAREGLINALKHSAASSISLVIHCSHQFLAVEVHDDGRGFMPSQVDRMTHFGIGLVLERVARVGGEVRIESDHGKGTILRASLPAFGDSEPRAQELLKNSP